MLFSAVMKMADIFLIFCRHAPLFLSSRGASHIRHCEEQRDAAVL